MNITNIVKTGIFIILLVCVGCSNKQSKMELELQTIKQKLIKIEMIMDSHNIQIGLFGNQIKAHELFYHHEHVVLDPTSPGGGYQRLDTSSGTFLISMKNVRPYLSGYIVTLVVGNVNNCTYKGFEVTAKWGKNYDWDKKDNISFEEWEKGLPVKSISIIKDLEPGTWHNVDLVLAPAKPDEFDFLKITIDTDVVALLKGK